MEYATHHMRNELIRASGSPCASKITGGSRGCVPVSVMLIGRVHEGHSHPRRLAEYWKPFWDCRLQNESRLCAERLRDICNKYVFGLSLPKNAE